MTDFPEADDPVIDGLAFMAEAIVLLGVIGAMGYALTELFKRKEQKEMER